MQKAHWHALQAFRGGRPCFFHLKSTLMRHVHSLPVSAAATTVSKAHTRRGGSKTAPGPEGGRDGVLGLLVRPGSASRLACTGRPSNGSLARALTHSRDGRPSLGSGFALRCSQRLSGPRAASRRCPWRDNRATVAASILVLAY